MNSRIWDMIDDCNINNRAKNQASAVVHSRTIRRSVSPKFKELCMETPCLCPTKDTEKRLSLSFAIEIEIFTLDLQHIEINAFSSNSTV